MSPQKQLKKKGTIEKKDCQEYKIAILGKSGTYVY